jgi:hypothetical protein
VKESIKSDCDRASREFRSMSNEQLYERLIRTLPHLKHCVSLVDDSNRHTIIAFLELSDGTAGG